MFLLEKLGALEKHKRKMLLPVKISKNIGVLEDNFLLFRILKRLSDGK